MKIAWFTPFHKDSAIGKFSKYAAQSLSKYVKVDLFVFEKDNLHNTDLNKIYYNEQNITSLINDYDFCIYNMGDNTRYHASVFDVMRLRRGIVIAHDLCLHNFFRAYYIALNNNDASIYYNVMVKLYGSQDALRILKAGDSFEEWNNLDLVKYNMSEELIPHSLGILVHSEHHKKIISKIYHGPICMTPLLYINESVSSKKFNNSSIFNSSKILNILTVGYVNPNKRIHSVIEAIGKSDILRENVYYTVVGSLSNQLYADLLNQMIKNYGIEDSIQLVGYTDDEDLTLYYQKADIVINLRVPALEGASASLIEQMNLGKIVVVSNTGMYSEMPDDCVIKIEPENEIKQLINKLENIISSPSLHKKYGENAKMFSEHYFSSEQYGEKLYDFIQQILFSKPLYSLKDTITGELRTINASSDMRICSAISEEIELLFSNKMKQ